MHFIGNFINFPPVYNILKNIFQIGKFIDVWTRPISPRGKSLAFAFLNLGTGGSPSMV